MAFFGGTTGGAPGPQGPQGPQGEQGPAGPNGPMGILTDVPDYSIQWPARGANESTSVFPVSIVDGLGTILGPQFGAPSFPGWQVGLLYFELGTDPGAAPYEFSDFTDITAVWRWDGADWIDVTGEFSPLLVLDHAPTDDGNDGDFALHVFPPEIGDGWQTVLYGPRYTGTLPYHTVQYMPLHAWSGAEWRIQNAGRIANAVAGPFGASETGGAIVLNAELGGLFWANTGADCTLSFTNLDKLGHVYNPGTIPDDVYSEVLNHQFRVILDVSANESAVTVTVPDWQWIGSVPAITAEPGTTTTYVLTFVSFNGYPWRFWNESIHTESNL